jgi:hypothetical protein
LSYFWLAVISVMFLFMVRSAWRSRKPENQVWATGSPTRTRIGALLFIGVGLFQLAMYARDPTRLWTLGFSLFWLLLGAFALVGPSYAELNESQRERARRRRARTWWVAPVSIVGFFAGFWPLALFVSKWAAGVFALVWLCGQAIGAIWLFFGLGMEPRVENEED